MGTYDSHQAISLRFVCLSSLLAGSYEVTLWSDLRQNRLWKLLYVLYQTLSLPSYLTSLSIRLGFSNFSRRQQGCAYLPSLLAHAAPCLVGA